MKKLNEYLTPRAAAEKLGVHELTIRRWVREGKIKAHKHPVNGRNILDPDEIEEMLRKIGEEY